MCKVQVLITGGNGFLGKLLRLKLENTNFSIVATGLGVDRLFNHNHIYVELDIRSKKRCEYVLNKYKPSIIINTAAFTDVDQCQKNQNKCLEINSNSVDYLISYSAQNHVHLIQISTDFVFNGLKGEYVENDTCDPINFYGFSKLEAEKKILNNDLMYTIVRTSLIYDMSGNNFFTRFLKKIKFGSVLDVVDDQYRTPTYVLDLVFSILTIMQLRKTGIYHISSGENLSIFDIVCNIVNYLELDSSLINRVQSRDLNQIVKRPMKSGLIVDKAKKDFNFTPTKLNDVLKKIL